MQDVLVDAPRQQLDAIGRWLDALARAAAILGGVVLTAAMVMIIVSIVGRQLLTFGLFGLGPVPGDYELVELASAIAVASFLPLTQMREGHVIVDLFFRGTGPRATALFGGISHLLFGLVMALLIWQLTVSLVEKRAFEETTMVLTLPIWWGFAAILPFLSLSVLCAAFMTVSYARAFWQGAAR